MNYKARFKNYSTNTKLTASNTRYKGSLLNLKGVILLIATLFLFTLATKAQCTVFDLPEVDQNKIVKAHLDLKECKELSKINQKLIIDLKRSNEELIESNTLLNTKVRKSRKWPVIALGTGIVAGFLLGNKN